MKIIQTSITFLILLSISMWSDVGLNQVMYRTASVERVPMALLNAQQNEGDYDISIQSRGIGMVGRSNQDNKFNYTMLFPPDFKQNKNSSALRLHDIELGFNYKAHKNVGLFTRLRFNPDRVYGGSLRRTVLNSEGQPESVVLGSAANSLKLTTMIREAYLYFGDLNESPIYAMMGKYRVPFGLQKTYSPFSLSMAWHYAQVEGDGATIGYSNNNNNLHATLSVLQTGPQLRNANQGEDGAVGNIVFDVKYQALDNLRVGGGYMAATSYCDKNFPTLHFKKCEEDNPGYIVNAELNISDKSAIMVEYFETEKPWGATQQPADRLTGFQLEHFKPTKVRAITIDYMYQISDQHRISLSYGKGLQGPAGSPWEFNEQTVLGYENRHSDRLTFFSELIFTQGFVPFQPVGGQFVDVGGGFLQYIPVSDRNTEQLTTVAGFKVTL